MNKFIELAKQYEALKKSMKEVRVAMDLEMEALGIDTYHQDPVTGCVYKIVRPTGTYVEFKTVTYERTALEDEKRGSLSKKEAADNGFILSK